MNEGLDKYKPEVRLRAFRAVDDLETCEQFLEGHTNVLTNIGVTKVTSSKNEWTLNPAAFVIVVESLDGKRVYGGARVHVAGGSEPLPIEQATGTMDPLIFDLVYKYAQLGTGEICGLWNSREIAGYGIGSIFLTRAAVAISTQMGLKTLFALCAPYTVKMAEAVGYHIETGIGDKGTFVYPKLDLIATTMINENLITLESADESERNAIFKLRESWNVVRLEELRGKSIEIHYTLNIPNLESWDLAYIISNLKKGTTKDADKHLKLNLL